MSNYENAFSRYENAMRYASRMRAEALRQATNSVIRAVSKKIRGK